MALSKEDRDKFESDFKYLIEKYIETTALYNKLQNTHERSPMEELELQDAQEILQTISEVLSVAMQALGDDLFGKAVDMYYQFKDAATAGDEQAQNLMKDLKPLFEASLHSRINNN